MNFFFQNVNKTNLKLQSHNKFDCFSIFIFQHTTMTFRLISFLRLNIEMSLCHANILGGAANWLLSIKRENALAPLKLPRLLNEQHTHIQRVTFQWRGRKTCSFSTTWFYSFSLCAVMWLSCETCLDNFINYGK